MLAFKSQRRKCQHGKSSATTLNVMPRGFEQTASFAVIASPNRHGVNHIALSCP